MRRTGVRDTGHMPAGLWKLFIIETKNSHEADEANKKIPKTALQTLTESWDEVLDNVHKS